MKKIIVTITAVLLFVAVYATDKVEKTIERSFESEFPGAKHVSWVKLKNTNIYSVRFVQAGEAFIAYFDIDGNYLAIAKSILEDNLPPWVKKSLSKINPTGALTTSEQINMKGEISYLFYFKENGEKKAYQISEGGGIKRVRMKEIAKGK